MLTKTVNKKGEGAKNKIRRVKKIRIPNSKVLFTQEKHIQGNKPNTVNTTHRREGIQTNTKFPKQYTVNRTPDTVYK